MEPITDENIQDLVKRYLAGNSGLPVINSWDVSNVTKMLLLFSNASNFNEPLNDWNVSNVRNMKLMFASASKFNQPLDKWNISNVTDMSYMFYQATNFNQSLRNWRIFNTVNISGMFDGAIHFNRNTNSPTIIAAPTIITAPTIPTITDENIQDLVKRYLAGNSGLPVINSWDVSNVTKMNLLFSNASNFNEPLNDWNVSNVRNMQLMFASASKFNQPLDKWNVSNVTDMSYMFYQATNFNQSLRNWRIFNTVNISGMFDSAIHFNRNTNSPTIIASPNSPTIIASPTTTPNVQRNNNGLTVNDNLDEDEDESDLDGYESLNEDEIEASEAKEMSELASELYNNKLYSIPLTNSTESINLQNSNYDAITMQEIQYSEYLKEDIANILIKYNGNVYFANKNSIKALVLDGSAIKYGCKTVSTSIIPKQENLYDEPCFNMNSIGIISGLVYLSKIKTILETNSLRVFEIPREPIMNYVSTASLQMLSSQPNAVGASHCQEGQSANVFDIKVIPYESTGGKKTRKRRKTRKSLKKSKKIRKIRKTNKSRKMKKNIRV